MPMPRTSKEKSARIDWGYFDRSDRLARVRGWLWGLAAVLVLVPLAVATVAAAWTDDPPAPLAAAASRGPLASPHAAWENQCEACHTPFTPIHTAQAARCVQCHAAPPHHPLQKAEAVAGCAECHRDHQGRDTSLVRLADGACVRCHGDLSPHQITGFAREAGHPEFQGLTENGRYQRTLKFSHAAHLAPGMGLGQPYTFARIPDPAERKRYMALLGATDDKAAVRLDCAACHQLDAARSDTPATPPERFAGQTRSLLGGLPKEPLQPPRAAGATYLPITFEQHCRACHPLTFDTGPGTVEAPHRVQPDELDRFLRRVYTERLVTEGLKEPPQPDRGPGRLDPPPARVEAARGKIEAAVASARITLLLGRTTCQECHFAESVAPARNDDPRLPARIKPPSVPTVWMPRARFDHTAHRAADCRQCHPGAYRTKADEDQTAADYQHPPDLPALADCRRCHAPLGGTRTAPTGGVRHGCTDCHSYHAADRRLQGHGADTRVPAERFGRWDEFLRGHR